MDAQKGYIVLMGSGELTATMVEVHKQLIAQLPGTPRAIFLDTPAGFQLNADQISQKAVEYFRTRVHHPMKVASLKAPDLPDYEREMALHTLRQAAYVLIGPGSPTYAVRVLGASPVPDILTRRISEGACLAAASAAALTVGRFTLPVYEIYKVGEALHWTEGMNILGAFGFDLTVVPHWNNAEGGTHDTRRCFMGEARFRELEAQLPPETAILGLDEHTACLIDFSAQEAVVNGLGRVVLRQGEDRQVFRKGDRIPLGVLRGETSFQGSQTGTADIPETAMSEARDGETGFWESIRRVEELFHRGLETNDSKTAANALLEIDRLIWQAHQDMENEEFIAQAREILRDMIVLSGHRSETSLSDRSECLGSIVESLLELRETFRQNRQWEAADALREILAQSGIAVEDTADGSRWRLEA